MRKNLEERTEEIYKKFDEIENNIKNNRSGWSAFFFLIALIFIFVGILSGYHFFVTKYLKFEGTAGTFGDMFGGINALFSGLAFGCIVLTLYFQKKELFMQRKELEMQRLEARLTRIVMEEQQKEMEESNTIGKLQVEAINLQASLLKEQNELIKEERISKKIWELRLRELDKERRTEHFKDIKKYRKSVRKVILSSTNLSGEDLSELDLEASLLDYANLANTKLINTNLNHCDLGNANLVNADFTGASLKEARLTNTKITVEQICKANNIDNITGLSDEVLSEVKEKKPELMTWWKP